ncbi:MAG: DUF4191 family protein [Micrococcales bacterium]
MAKTEKIKREPGRIRQLMQVYALTAKTDKRAVLWSVAAFAGLLATGLLIANAIAPGSVVASIMWGLLGATAGLLLAMIIMSRRAEAAAYMRFEGQPGATGAVLSSALRRGWRFNEMPVHVSPKTQELVYRAVGPAGIVLIGEGTSKARVQAMVEDERRKAARVANGVTITALYVVVGDPHSIPLAKLAATIFKLKRSLDRSEVSAVANRLDSIGTNIPVPKGMDPNKVRQPRQR